MQFLARGASLLIAGCLASVAHAAPITFDFTGSVTDDPFGLSSFGAPISGSYTFGSTAVDAVPGSAVGSYLSSGAGFGLAASVDGTPYSVAGAVAVSVFNAAVDQYLVTAMDATLTLELFFEDATGTAFASDALPLTPPALGDFAFRRFRLFGTDVEFLGTVASLTCSAGCDVATVPEPDTLALLGLAGLAFLHRRRARQRSGR